MGYVAASMQSRRWASMRCLPFISEPICSACGLVMGADSPSSHNKGESPRKGRAGSNCPYGRYRTANERADILELEAFVDE